MRKFIFLLLYLVFTVQNIHAQNNSTKKRDSISVSKDSMNVELLSNYNKKLITSNQEKSEDSIRRDELELQINALKNKDNVKREELKKEILELDKKEAIRIAKNKEQIDLLQKNVKGYPVIGFFKDTLFSIYNKFGSFSAEERANTITKRIEQLADKYDFKQDSLQVLTSEMSTDIVYGDMTIMSVSDTDALYNNESRNSLAKKYQEKIDQNIKLYKSETNLVTLAKEVGLALLVLLIIFILIKYIGKFFNWTALKIQEQEDKKIKGINIKDYTLFDANRQVSVLLKGNMVLKWFFILLTIYITLPILFGIFPWTKGFASVLFGYIINPIKKIAYGLWEYLPNLITIIVIVIVFSYLLKGINFLKEEIQNGKLHIAGFYPDWANPTYQIIRVLLYAFMITVIFPYLPGSDSPIFQGVSVFLGVLFTFGSSGPLSNIIAGLVLTYMRSFKIGDRVKIGDLTGDIIEKSLLVTRIRTAQNEIISLPNSNVMSSHTINYSSDASEKGLIIHTTVTIGYDVPWRIVHKALMDAAAKTESVLKDPKPFVLQTSLDDYYVSYEINAYTKLANKQGQIYSDLHQNIQDVFNENGIEILSPHYRQLRDGNMVTIPKSYLDKDYEAPHFDVRIKKE